MMFQSEMSASLYTDETLTAATFPYQGDELSMTVYLPREDIKLSELEESLTAEKIEDIRLNGFEREVSTHMPKFEIRSNINLNQPLIKLGMSSLFVMDYFSSYITQLYLTIVFQFTVLCFSPPFFRLSEFIRRQQFQCISAITKTISNSNIFSCFYNGN